MDIYVDNLVLEITRRCNMKCRHCMRGPARRLDMDKQVINRILGQIDQLSSVTITGGEPSLNVPAIVQFKDWLWMYRKRIQSFYVVSNGKKNSQALCKALLDLYMFTDQDYDEGMTTLAMSRDQYHEGLKIPRAFQALSFFKPEAKSKDIPWEAILDEGRAHENGLGSNKRENKWSFLDDDMDADGTLRVELVNISANGNVNPTCDLSYARADKESSGNVLEESLEDILLRAWRKIHPEQELKEAA